MYVMAWSTVTKYHNLSSLNNRHLFLTVLESGKSKVKTGAWLSSDESTLGLQTMKRGEWWEVGGGWVQGVRTHSGASSLFKLIFIGGV